MLFSLEMSKKQVAERLKILLCKRIANQTSHLEIPTHFKNSSEKETISVPVHVETINGILKQDSFFLTFKELSEAMQIFLKKSHKTL